MIQETGLKVGGIENEWGEVDERRTGISTRLELAAPNMLVGRVDNLGVDYTADINGVEVVSADKRGIRLGRDRTVVDIDAEMDNSRIPEWWVEHVENDETSRLRVKPQVSLDLPVENVAATARVPRAHTTVETDILGCLNTDEAREKTVLGRTVFVVEGLSAEWDGVTRDETGVDVEARVRNPNRFGVSVSRLDCDVLMNDVRVGGGSAGDLSVGAGERGEVDVDVTIDNDRLPEWWVTHIRNDEETELRVVFHAVFGVFGYEVRLPVFGYDDTIETDFLF